MGIKFNQFKKLIKSFGNPLVQIESLFFKVGQQQRAKLMDVLKHALKYYLITINMRCLQKKQWNEKIINKLKRQKLVRDSNGKDKDENLMSIPKIYIPATKYQEGYTKLIKQISYWEFQLYQLCKDQLILKVS